MNYKVSSSKANHEAYLLLTIYNPSREKCMQWNSAQRVQRQRLQAAIIYVLLLQPSNNNLKST